MWWESDLRALVEYYLSDRNLRSDRPMRDKILADVDGWIDMEVLPGCQGEGKQAEFLGALSASKCVETKVSEDGKVFVRRGGGRPVPMLEDGKTKGMKRTAMRSEWGSGGRNDDPTCWDWKNKGFCPRGASCRYQHGPTNASPQSAVVDGVSAQADAAGLVAAPPPDECLALTSAQPSEQPKVSTTPAPEASSAPKTDGSKADDGKPDASPQASAVPAETPAAATETSGAATGTKREAPEDDSGEGDAEKWRKRAARFGLPGSNDASTEAETKEQAPAATPA